MGKEEDLGYVKEKPDVEGYKKEKDDFKMRRISRQGRGGGGEVSVRGRGGVRGRDIGVQGQGKL